MIKTFVIFVSMLVLFFTGFIFSEKADAVDLGYAYMVNGKCLQNGSLCGVTSTPIDCCLNKYPTTTSIDTILLYSFGSCCYNAGPVHPETGAVCTGSCNSSDPCSFTENYSQYYQCNFDPPPSTCSIAVNPDSFLQGESPNITIKWTTTFAASATLNGTPVPVASLATGSQIFTAVSSATSYTMNITGLDGGAISCVTNVSVIAPVNVVLDFAPATIETDIAAIITNVIKWLLEVAGYIALLMLIFAGVMYITSSGNSEATEKAKKFISVIISGLILILFSYAILFVINHIFT